MRRGVSHSGLELAPDAQEDQCLFSVTLQYLDFDLNYFLGVILLLTNFHYTHSFQNKHHWFWLLLA